MDLLLEVEIWHELSFEVLEPEPEVYV